jgi:hypothetical protein
MHARHYHPTLGRFLQPDPDGSEANLYAYTANNPVTELDPDGTCFIILCIAVGVVLFGGLGAGAGVLRYSTGTEPWLDRSDSLGDAAVNGFVEAGSYAIPGAGVGALARGTGILAKALTKVPGAARVLLQTGRKAASSVRGIKVRGGEIVFSRNFRIKPLLTPRAKNRWTGELQPWPARLPHYHTRGPGGIDRHRPWEARPGDTQLWDRF